MRKIIWAIEAHLDFDQTEKTIIQTLNTLTRTGNQRFQFQIEPVHVLPAAYTVAPDPVMPMPVDLHKQAMDILTEKLSRVDLPGLLQPQVLYEPIFTNKQAALTLVKYAQDTRADLIVVGTHAKKGLARLFLGSFAESLILDSAVPVFTVNPNTKAPKSFERILFPTDFEKESKAVFANVLEFARELGASVTIYHMVVDPFGLTPQSRPTAYQVEYIESQREYARIRAEEFLNQANEAGVRGSYLIAISSSDISGKIIKFAKKKNIQLIAMAARSGRIASVITGSTTRQVVRASPWPVWVLREKAAAKAAKKAA